MIYTVSNADPRELELCSEDSVTIALQSVYNVLLTRKGTVPMDRNYGLSQEFLDAPVSVALPMIIADVKEAIEDSVPDVAVASVNAENGEDGQVIITVEVEVGEDDE